MVTITVTLLVALLHATPPAAMIHNATLVRGHGVIHLPINASPESDRARVALTTVNAGPVSAMTVFVASHRAILPAIAAMEVIQAHQAVCVHQ